MGSRAAGTPAMDLVKDDDNEGHRDLITEVQVRIRDGGDMVVAAAVNMILLKAEGGCHGYVDK